MSKFVGAYVNKLVDEDLQDFGTPDNPISVSVSGAGSGGTSSVDKVAFVAGTSAGTAMMGTVNPTDVGLAADKVAIAALDEDRNICVNIKASTVSGSNPAASATGAAVPAAASYTGVKVGANLQGAVGFDLDSGAGTEYGLGVSLRKIASGGSVEAGTATDPLRTDPTGSTTQPISASSLPLPTGAATAAKQPALGTAGSASSDVITVQGVASMTPLQIADNSGSITVDQSTASNLKSEVQGPAAVGAAASGNPLRIGGLGRTTVPSIVDAGDIVDMLLDRLGRTFVVSPVCTTVGSNTSAISTATTTSIVSAPSAGNHIRVYRLWAQNTGGDTSTFMGYWCDGTTKKIPFYLKGGQPFSMAIDGRWELTTATALQIVSTSVSNSPAVEWYVEYEVLTD